MRQHSGEEVQFRTTSETAIFGARCERLCAPMMTAATTGRAEHRSAGDRGDVGPLPISDLRSVAKSA
ncbi:hypothetical protein ACXHXM_15610